MKKLYSILPQLNLLIACTAITPILLANGENPPHSIFDKMNYQEVLDMTLEVDLEALLEDRHSEEDYKANLSFTDASGQTQIWDTEVNLRGKFRRMKCTEMPPLKLNFKKGDLAAVGLSSSNDLKLVTHCVEDKYEAKELLLKEYLAYKLYNEITEASYRVQLVHVTYKDINTRNKRKQWAFLIEDTAQVRNRLNAEKCKDCKSISSSDFDTKQFKMMAMFQYMIGNADWNYKMNKNMKTVKSTDSKLVAIPYDFDFSGLVNAPYATVNSNYHLTSKQDRVYLGFEKDLQDMEVTYQHFLNRKDKLIETVRNFKKLDPVTRKEVIDYLETFYEEGLNIKTKADYSALSLKPNE